MGFGSGLWDVWTEGRSFTVGEWSCSRDEPPCEVQVRIDAGCRYPVVLRLCSAAEIDRLVRLLLESKVRTWRE